MSLEEKEKICNHDIKDKKTTLKKIKSINMVYPRIDEYMCEVCHNFFEFKKE